MEIENKTTTHITIPVSLYNDYRDTYNKLKLLFDALEKYGRLNWTKDGFYADEEFFEVMRILFPIQYWDIYDKLKSAEENKASNGKEDDLS